MTDGVINLRPDVELDDFLTFMWGDNVGYAYLPLKLPNTDEWEKHFFQWPVKKQQIIEHILQNTATAECYFSPALYKSSDSPEKDNLLGSQIVWADFDGNSPKDSALGDKVPLPTMRVRSSLEGHDHLYWRLNQFETDRSKIEQINRSIAYMLNADSSGWDANQILRPPNTKNHKRDKVVRVLTRSASTYGYEFFEGLEIPKQLTKEDIELEEVPEPLTVVAKYKWNTEDWEFFRKKDMAAGTRSSALMRLAYVCAEMRMSDEEAFAILANADERWKKFHKRTDRTRRLLDLINRARHKYPIDPEVVIDEFPVYGWQELLDLEIHVDWMIKGILQRQGLMVVAGAPGAGKTQICLQVLMHLAIGKSFLGWDMGPARKVCFFSMEMGPAELKFIQEQMNAILKDEEKKLLAENFMLVPIGHGVMFESTIDRRRIEHLLKTRKPECIVFDSLSTTTMDELSEERTAKRVMDIASQMRQEFDTSIIFIHHNRKAQVNNKKPNGLSDVYGSNFITAQATTVLGVWRNLRTNEIELSWLKVRLAKEPDDMCIIRVEGLMFEEVSMTGLTQEAEEKRKEAVSDQAKREQPSGQEFLRM